MATLADYEKWNAEGGLGTHTGSPTLNAWLGSGARASEPSPLAWALPSLIVVALVAALTIYLARRGRSVSTDLERAMAVPLLIAAIALRAVWRFVVRVSERVIRGLQKG